MANDNNEIKISITSDLNSQGFNSANQEISKLDNSTSKLSSTFNSFLGLATAFGAVTLFKEQVSQALDFADSLNKLSQKTGITADGLYSLSAAAKLSDVDFASLESSLAKFSKGIGEASMGTGTAKDAFERLGVSIQNQDGTLKDSFALLTELSDKFEQLPDGAIKATTAMEIFGKSGSNMIPLLNGGSESLKRFTGIMNEETAQAAEKFNDSLTELHMSSNAFFLKTAKELVPTLEIMTGHFTDLAKESNELGDALSGKLATSMKGIVKWGYGIASVFDISTTAISNFSSSFGALLGGDEDKTQKYFKKIGDDFWKDVDKWGKAINDLDKAEENRLKNKEKKETEIIKGGLEDRFNRVVSDTKAIEKLIFEEEEKAQEKRTELAKKHSEEMQKFNDDQFALLAQNSEKSFKQLDAVKDWEEVVKDASKNATNAMKSMQDAMITYYEAIGDSQSAYYAKEAKLIDELKDQRLLSDTQINAIIASNREKFRTEQFEKENKWLYDFFGNMNKALDNELLDGFRGKFKSFGDWLEDLFASVGDSIFASMSRTFAGGITDTLQGGIVNSFKSYGLFGGASLVGSTLSASDMSSLVNSGATVSGGKITTSGGTIIDQANGMVTNQGSDAMSLLSTASSLKTAYGVLTDGISGSILSGFNGIGNLVGNFGFGGVGGAISNFGAGFTSPLSFATQSPLAGLYGSGVVAEIPMATMAGGMLSSGLIGYGMGSLGDAIFGAKTKAGTLGAVGAAIGSIIPGIGTLLGGIIGSVLGGFFGSTKQTGAGIDILGNASADNASGQYWQSYKKKSWFSSSSWTDIVGFSDAENQAIMQTISVYDTLLSQLGEYNDLVVAGGRFTNLQSFLDTNVVQSFLTAINPQNLDTIYQTWVDYAKEIDSTITEALASAVSGFTTYKRGYQEWFLGSGTTEQLEFTANYLQKDFEALASSLGASSVTVDNFLSMYDEAIKNNFTQDTIEAWSSLGDALMKATDANSKYQDALDELTATTMTFKPKDMMLSKVNNQTNNESTSISTQLLVQIVKALNSIKDNQVYGAQI